MKNSKRVLWLLIGYSVTVLGAVGVFVPLLPTVPFLLLAVFCFLRSSPARARRLLNNKWLGPPLRDYYQDKSVKRSVKIKSIAFLWVSLCVSMIFIQLLWVRLLLACIGIAVTIHILALKTKKQKIERG